MSVRIEKTPFTNCNENLIQNHEFNEESQKNEDSRKSIEVAEYLLDKKLFLSALEYYFEQLERGKSIKLLHEFFTSPNFVDNLNLSSVESSSLLMGKQICFFDYVCREISKLILFGFVRYWTDIR